MLRYLPLTPFVGALLLLACGKSDPVVEEAVAPPDSMVGDSSATGLAAPANASAAEAAQQAALPGAPGGLSWAYRAADRSALFGPPGEPAFSIQCQSPREGMKQLVFVRFLRPESGATGTLSFTGNGQASSIPVSAIVAPDGISGQWRTAISSGDNARAVARTFAGPGAVEVSVGGTPPLVVPATAEPRRVLAECLRG